MLPAVADAQVSPDGAAGWLRKLAFEVQDEPEGVLYLLLAFLTLAALAAVHRMWRARGELLGPAAATREGGAGASGVAAEHEDDEQDDAE
ncbi:MAG: hypothetical protein AB1689_10260, partial [Thermodesulfobacteriota bacterium]